jgi:peptidoglycan-associated lipoprotein
MIMKIKMMYPIGLAMAVVIASTGCKTAPSGVRVGDTWPAIGPTPIPPAGTISPGYRPDTEAAPPQNRLPVYMPDVPSQDRNALAAYTIHFALDSAVIRDGERSKLQGVTAALQSDPDSKLLIEGNCDDRGTEEYNRTLGERRALAAREALAKMGIDPIRVHTISYGKDRPVELSHNEASWWKNRHDDFVLVHLKLASDLH